MYETANLDIAKERMTFSIPAAADGGDTVIS
jgi:hypothetical protein